MLTPTVPELLHIVGYLTGGTLYVMLLVMVLRAGRDRLTVGTAILGVAWNAGELAAHAFDGVGFTGARDWMAAASYAALGLLAAAVVHSVSRVRVAGDPQGGPTASRTLAWIAYGCAGSAGLMQLGAAARGSTLPSPAALVLLTAGLLAVMPLLATVTRRHGNGRRALWMTALAVFAVSALHLGSFHGANESLVTELLGHHASIPLAFAILYQDYRFALADLFLKQALTLLALVAIVFAGWAVLAPSFTSGAPAPAAIGALLGLWVATALLAPWLHRRVAAFVDRVVLMRANNAALIERIGALLQECESEVAVLDRACEALAPAVSASAVAWEPRELSAAAALPPHEPAILTAESPQYVLMVGPLAGGRRLLSDDLTMLERASRLVARRIDTLRLADERYERMLREREMRALATEAELKALRAQINPHFLFNALTTMGYLIETAPPRALQTLLRLTTLLRGVLRSEGEFTTLGHERELIECYLQIEHERFEERLQVRIDIPGDLAALPIPSLILLPLVENAIKHGIARSRHGGRVDVIAGRTAGGRELRITVRNTGGALHGRAPAHDEGLGLRNVERRLACYYGEAAAFTLAAIDGATVAELRLPLEAADDANVAVVSRAARA